MRPLHATAAAAILALTTACTPPPPGTPEPNTEPHETPTAEPATASSSPSPSASPSPSSSASIDPLEPVETPTGSENLPDIWPEISGMWIALPSDTRDNYCTMLDSGHPVDALAVKAIATQYKVSTGDDPDTRDVHAVLAWLCASNTTP